MRKVVAKDTLRTHFTLIGKAYTLMDEDEECYKILDERGQVNWIPKCYMAIIESQEEGHEKD